MWILGTYLYPKINNFLDECFGFHIGPIFAADEWLTANLFFIVTGWDSLADSFITVLVAARFQFLAHMESLLYCKTGRAIRF